jgi:Ca-activated chloride channel family protein
MQFKDPQFLYLLILLPLWFFIREGFQKNSIQFSSFENLGSGMTHRKPLVPTWLRLLALIFLILALARPQTFDSEREFFAEGIDIVLSMDVSGSMNAEDFHPQNRLAIAKEEAKRFILGRKNDRIGLVVFAKKSFTQCPLTLDYEILTRLLDDVSLGVLQDGTAIGMGLANAVNRLRESKAKSKVIILLTDGENNSGNIDPLTAAQLAKGYGIKIYTIGIGKDGLVPFPVDDPIFGRRYIQANFKIDEKSMSQIASITGGRFFRARDPNSLREIYKVIDQMEKTKVQVKNYESVNEIFPYFLAAGLLFLVLERILSATLYFQVP